MPRPSRADEAGDFIRPSIAEICVPRLFTKTKTLLPLRGFCTKGFSFTRSSYSATNSCPITITWSCPVG